MQRRDGNRTEKLPVMRTTHRNSMMVHHPKNDPAVVMGFLAQLLRAIIHEPERCTADGGRILEKLSRKIGSLQASGERRGKLSHRPVQFTHGVDLACGQIAFDHDEEVDITVLLVEISDRQGSMKVNPDEISAQEGGEACVKLGEHVIQFGMERERHSESALPEQF